MKEQIERLKKCYSQQFDARIAQNSYIKIAEDESALYLIANQEGFLTLVEALIELCDDEKKHSSKHLRLDESGMANTCEKPLVISLVSAPWDPPLPPPLHAGENQQQGDLSDNTHLQSRVTGMKEKIENLKECYDQVVDARKTFDWSLIEILNSDSEIVIRANQNGLLLLIKALVDLCDDEAKFMGRHYHFDEAGMADTCEKPMIVSLVNAPWDPPLPAPGESVKSRRMRDGIR